MQHREEEHQMLSTQNAEVGKGQAETTGDVEAPVSASWLGINVTTTQKKIGVITWLSMFLR